jgi:uncharacterized protein with GYD domain
VKWGFNNQFALQKSSSTHVADGSWTEELAASKSCPQHFQDPTTCCTAISSCFVPRGDIVPPDDRPGLFILLVRLRHPAPTAQIVTQACVNTWRTACPHSYCRSTGTDQGIRSVKDAPERAKAAREFAKKVGVEIKEVYLISGADDLLAIVDTANGDNVAKFALALGAQGNVRTRTARAWPQSEFQKLISELYWVKGGK